MYTQVESFTASKITSFTKAMVGALFLVWGSMIYLLFRSKSLNIYLWSKALGISSFIDSLRACVGKWEIPDMVIYSLPDGLYCAAYILLIDAIWNNNNGIIKYIFISLVPFATIISEILQYYGLVKGTFDIYDLLCYLLPTIIYITIKI